MTGDAPHSAALFGETRDFWWNADFIALMAQRWRLGEVRYALDVGCGLGHWGRTLLPHLASDAMIEGIDPEPRWTAAAGETACRQGLGNRLRYSVAAAESLPFPDNSFDLVTCQTLLVHLPDTRRALRQMIRVLKPGGLLAVAEPNNLAFALMLGLTRSTEPPGTTLALVRLQLICERGKIALGEGDNSIGDLIPGLFNDQGLVEIAVHQSDHAFALFPPYPGAEQQANRAELLDLADRGIYIWDRPRAERYFLAGGGSITEFAPLWQAALDVSRAVAEALRAQREHQAGGSAFYLVAGRKPAGLPP
jgi:SAM-dependent methyltransferase